MQLIKEKHEVLEDVGRNPEAKVVEYLICYDQDEPSSDCFFLFGENLEEQERIELIQFLIANIEVFAWIPNEMPSIDPNLIKHMSNILPKAQPLKQ